MLHVCVCDHLGMNHTYQRTLSLETPILSLPVPKACSSACNVDSLKIFPVHMNRSTSDLIIFMACLENHIVESPWVQLLYHAQKILIFSNVIILWFIKIFLPPISQCSWKIRGRDCGPDTSRNSHKIT